MFSFFFNNSKKKIVIILLITVVFGLFLINVENAEADIISGPMGITLPGGLLGTGGAVHRAVYQAVGGTVNKIIGDFAEQILEGMAYLIWSAAVWFVGFCAALFTSILNNSTEHLAKTAVYDGWKITRDIVNMFFILGLVVISFATILRIEPYRAKALLPKLIIIAILINFSFLACGIIIDSTNILANYFSEKLKEQAGEKIGVGGLIQSAMIEIPSKVPEPEYEDGNENSENEDEEKSGVALGDFTAFILAQLSQAIIMGIAGFVLLIGAILLVIRMGALWILIILVPFAWFLGVFPSTKHLAKKWWDNFLKYAFFAPIYLFFVWMSLKIMNSLTLESVKIEGSNVFKQSIQEMTAYTIAVMLLLGAPIVAMSMGIYGSKTVIGGAKKVLKGAGTGIKRYTGRKTETAARRILAPEKISQGLAGLHVIPGFKALSRVTGRWAAKGSTKINEIAKKQPDLSEKETIGRVQTATNPYEKMAWIQKLSSVAETDKGRELVKKNLKKYEAMGGNAVKDVISNDLTFTRNDNERKIAANIRAKTGKVKLSNAEANDINSVEAMRTAMGTKEFISACEKMPAAIKNALTDTLLDSANTSETPISRDSLNQRKVFADLTHDIEKAFTYNGTTDVANLERYINTLKPQELGKIKGSANLKRVAKTIDSGTASSARRHFSKEQANMVGPFFPEKVAAELKKSPSWASHIP